MSAPTYRELVTFRITLPTHYGPDQHVDIQAHDVELDYGVLMFYRSIPGRASRYIVQAFAPGEWRMVVMLDPDEQPRES